jgi:hypothetical protein|tara:strand:+ start:618 stop:722 length:105 start_codon:yes stop_codon:yes gene_type:complete
MNLHTCLLALSYETEKNKVENQEHKNRMNKNRIK